MDKITVACVNVGNKYPDKYVNKMYEAVQRHLSLPHAFVCVTDRLRELDDGIKQVITTENLQGWWNKVFLFEPNLFKGRVLYLDLDVMIYGSLDEIATYPADFASIWDWHYKTCYNTSVMVWDAEKCHHVWENFKPVHIVQYRSDQEYITDQIEDKRTFPDDWCLSFKKHGFKPCKVLVFHGRPNPHEIIKDW